VAVAAARVVKATRWGAMTTRTTKMISMEEVGGSVSSSVGRFEKAPDLWPVAAMAMLEPVVVAMAVEEAATPMQEPERMDAESETGNYFTWATRFFKRRRGILPDETMRAGAAGPREGRMGGATCVQRSPTSWLQRGLPFSRWCPVVSIPSSWPPF
jgi:hypothetical protein